MEALQALAADKGISVDTLMAALADALESAYKRMPGRPRVRLGHHRPGQLRHPGLRPGDRRGRRALRPRARRHAQRLRPHRRPDRPPGHDPAHPRGRARAPVRGVRRPRGRHRHRHRPAGRQPLHPARASARSRRCCPRPSRCPTSGPEPNTRLKAYIVEVRRTSKGPQIVVSRTHPGLILELFKLEVPEIADGIVEIKACAREPGHRTKIAVWSNDNNVDPVGACVGARGARVRRSSTSCGARRSTSSPSATTPTSSSPRRCLRPRSRRSASTRTRASPRSSCPTTSCPWPSARRARTPAWRPGSPAGGSTSRARRSSSRRRRYGQQDVGRGRVGGRPRDRRAGLAARRGWPRRVGRGVGGRGAEAPRRQRRAPEGDSEATETRGRSRGDAEAPAGDQAEAAGGAGGRRRSRRGSRRRRRTRPAEGRRRGRDEAAISTDPHLRGLPAAEAPERAGEVRMLNGGIHRRGPYTAGTRRLALPARTPRSRAPGACSSGEAAFQSRHPVFVPVAGSARG